jgi:hypothetical protein
VTGKDSGSEIRKIYERPGALLLAAHDLKIPGKNRKKI